MEFNNNLKSDNWITGKDDVSNYNSPYYEGADLSGAIFCPVCRRYFDKNGFELEYEDTIGLLPDEWMCEDCFNEKLADEVDNYFMED